MKAEGEGATVAVLNQAVRMLLDIFAGFIILCSLPLTLGGLIGLFIKRWRLLAIGAVLVGGVLNGTATAMLSNRDDQRAVARGFESGADRRAAEQAGFADSSAWIAHKEDQRREAERLAAEEAARAAAEEAARLAALEARRAAEAAQREAEAAQREAERQAEEAAERERQRQQAEWRARNTQTPEQRQRAEAARLTSCRRDLTCWAREHYDEASLRCQFFIENSARFDFRWTNSFFDKRFPRHGWYDQASGTLVYGGDRLELQNGFGAWMRHRYTCIYSPDTKLVLDVDIEPGRL